MRIAILMICAFMFSAFAHAETASVSAQKEWTFLIFMNGHHDDLDPYTNYDLNEMETIGSTGDVNVVVQWASRSYGNTRRVLVTRDENVFSVSSPILEELPQVDMGDYRNLIEFIRWGVQNFPAKHYFVDVWNHGGGWDFWSRGQIFRDISGDPLTGNRITTAQLGEAMKTAAQIIGHKVDIYGSDACLMGMAEVATEMSESVEVFVGSEEGEPMNGWPYDALLSQWTSHPTATAAEISRILVETYLRSYQTGGTQGEKEVTLSSLDLSKMEPLLKAIKKLAAEIASAPADELATVRDAMDRSPMFLDGADLGAVLTLLENRSFSSLRADTLRETQQALHDVVIANADTPAYARATGLAIWAATDWSSSTMKKYRSLSFDKKTNWSAALEKLSN